MAVGVEGSQNSVPKRGPEERRERTTIGGCWRVENWPLDLARCGL